MEKEALEEWKREIQRNEIQQISPSTIAARNFDPNKISMSEFLALGFDEKVARRIIKYRNKGGRFHSKDDLNKIYGIDHTLVRSYWDYIMIPRIQQYQQKVKQVSYAKPAMRAVEKTKPITVYLNSSDSTELKSIKGVGSYWSNRIIKYRVALGGFISKDQIREMYGIREGLADSIIKSTELGESNVKKYNINSSSLQYLAKHPYLSYRTAKSIIKYRKEHGNYQSIDQLKKVVSITDSVYVKISPYLETR
jgi:DNA uptake protein ComE-like DNA-binding protein